MSLVAEMKASAARLKRKLDTNALFHVEVVRVALVCVAEWRPNSTTIGGGVSEQLWRCGVTSLCCRPWYVPVCLKGPVHIEEFFLPKWFYKKRGGKGD